ncbi:winged helix-turn-helix transcriptional regulator [Cytobacillus firmus]|uniref:winged helix-turn-helix transcriptional regulator n=1 Tax=Cytobacillus firmus TaxID=1399 RepID=UPI0036ADCC39
MGKNVVNFSEAERKARLRDLENEKVLTEEEMQQANDLQAKANSRGMKLVPEKKVKSKVRFVQIIQDNIGYLMETDYLKNEEIKFLFRIMPYIAFRSNCIVDDIHRKDPTPITQSEIAQKIGSSQPTVNRLTNQLIDKGIIAKAETAKDGANARSYALFLNPNIVFCGDRDNVNETLIAMFKKANRKLKNLPQMICF